MKVKHVDHRMSNLRTNYVGGEFAQVKVEHVDQQEEDLKAKAHVQKSKWGGAFWNRDWPFFLKITMRGLCNSFTSIGFNNPLSKHNLK